MSDTLLLSILSSSEYVLLRLVVNLSEDTANVPNTTAEITLQQNYISSMFRMSATTVSKAIKRLIELNLIQRTHNKVGECATYLFNKAEYNKLLKAAKKTICKTPHRYVGYKYESSSAIYGYMTGKSIVKASKSYANQL